MKRTLSALVITIFAATLTVNHATAQDNENASQPKTSREESDHVQRPKVIIFDVNETLLDLAPLKTSVGKALGGREDLLPLWFSTMLHYSLVETLTDNYHHFGEIGTAALMMVAQTQGIELSYEEAKTSIVTPLRSLPPHGDVLAAITALSKAGYTIVSLTNSSAKGVETQFQNAGLTELFEKRYTVESLKKYKPHPDTYRMVLKDLGVQPEQVLMVAAHAWDIAGATNAGLQTAFVARPGKALYPLAPKPDYVVKDLTELVQALEKTRPAATAK
ncbi:Haloacetate dehalogenase H-2 [Rosistilla carotiformis]|uniref:Haloacetate dehalogenase H-2 n=1 Tax=Rosistilla carotiformis TaxID=2528017 RepID=A0A518JV77_9BACT|nr:haloacid dehalogenase type II [Rosistilla carotiformis]QDV69453.1 Haloacetate dehalogenase H-2 [Rosistilla carotiformis]